MKHRIIIVTTALGLLAACGTPAPTQPPVVQTVLVPQTVIVTPATNEPLPTETRVATATSTMPSRSPTPLITGTTRATPNVPDLRGVFGSPITFATHDELDKYGFSAGPSDGEFGAIPVGSGNYIFYGYAASSASCAGTPKVAGTYSFTGTLDHVNGSNGCKRVFGLGDGPPGWIFDKNYAGGGEVVRFALNGKSGWLMPFHGEVWWENPQTPDHRCGVSGGSTVPCFYSSLGLAISTDDGKTFKVVGEIMEPSQPMSAFKGTGKSMNVGYGSLIVADANGKHLDNPPANPNDAYFYLFYTDLLPTAPGVCATQLCMGVARAPYAKVIEAALSGDPHQVAQVFHKYNGASPNPWTQPATSDTPALTGTAGAYAPLITDEPGGVEVIYDKSFDAYLAIFHDGTALNVRASSDLLHWSEPIGASYRETGRIMFFPTFIGETGDPTIAGTAPRIYFSSFPIGAYPDYKTAILESVPLNLSRGH